MDNSKENKRTVYFDKNGIPEAYVDSRYFQIPKELESKVKELLDNANIPNKSFDHPEKVYFEAKAEVLLHGKISMALPEIEQQKMMQASLNNREEYGKMLFEEFWSNPILVENDMYKRVIERMELDDFLGKLTRGE